MSDEELVQIIVAEILNNPDFELKLSYKDRKLLSESSQLNSKIILQQQLVNDANLFLQNYNDFISTDSMQNYFLQLPDTSVHYTAQQLIQQRVASKKQIKNRRLEYMQQVLLPNGYFSWEQMRLRRPDLYEEYIGQYETKANKLHTKNVPQSVNFGHTGDLYQANMKLYDRLLYNLDLNNAFEQHNMTQVLKQNEEPISKMSVEEQKEETEEEENTITQEDAEAATEAEKQEWRNEFLELMKQEFLNGKDYAFVNYSKIDSTDSNDNFVEHDFESDYFFETELPENQLQYEQQREEAKQEEDYWKFPL